MAVRASKPRYVHSSAVSRCEGETSFNQIQVGGQGGRSEASRWGNFQCVLGHVEDQGVFLATPPRYLSSEEMVDEMSMAEKVLGLNSPILSALFGMK